MARKSKFSEVRQREIVAGWPASDVEVDRYAESMGVSKATLYNWRRRWVGGEKGQPPLSQQLAAAKATNIETFKQLHAALHEIQRLKAALRIAAPYVPRNKKIQEAD